MLLSSDVLILIAAVCLAYRAIRTKHADISVMGWTAAVAGVLTVIIGHGWDARCPDYAVSCVDIGDERWLIRMMTSIIGGCGLCILACTPDEQREIRTRRT